MADVVPAKGNLCFPARIWFAILGAMAMGIIYGMKVCMSVCLVSMVNHTALAKKQLISRSAIVEDDQEDGPFEWSGSIQSWILSGYFIGYIVSQIPGGMIAAGRSAKWVLFTAIMLNVVAVGLTPVCAHFHYWAVIVLRIIEGIGGGLSFPGMHTMLAAWAPNSEKSRMTTLVYAGTSLGTVASILGSGWIASAMGWEAVFYIFSGLSIIWVVMWMIITADTPEGTRFISMEERTFILEGTDGRHHGSGPVPWGAVFSSVPFWAILLAHFCSNFGWYMVLIEIPFYMKQVLKLSLSENATLSAIPYFTLWIFSMLLSSFLDRSVIKGRFSVTTARKISTLIASVVPAICLGVLCVYGEEKSVTIAMNTLGTTAFGAMFSGFMANHLDISPNFAGTLMAITNSVGTIPGICVPPFIAFMTRDKATIAEWRIIFLVTIVALSCEAIVYTLFGSGEVQPWNVQ